jgi:hypothetical protein
MQKTENSYRHPGIFPASSWRRLADRIASRFFWSFAAVITSRLRTLRDHIRWAVSRFHGEDLFFGHGTDNAWDEARQLVLGALHLPWEIADSYLDCAIWKKTSWSTCSCCSSAVSKNAFRLPICWAKPGSVACRSSSMNGY